MKLLDYSGLQRFLNKIKTLLDSKSNTGHTHVTSDVSGLATVATSGSYNDLSNTPTIPTVNNATLTIQKNGTTVNTFTANASSNVTANITVPTAVSELTNDSGYLTSASSLDSSKLTGTIDIARLPKGALERLVTVADQTARFALTTSDVQLGDTVKQLDTGVMYIVTDESKLSSADGYTEYTAGAATSVPWSGVTGKPSSYTPASHSHGNITNDGKVGTTANLPLITGTGGAVTAGSFGNQANTFCEGNDSRLSDARTPLSHTHTKSDVTDLLNSNFIPSANNSYDLGSSSYQWNKVYSKEYYYNGTEFQSKFVTLDTAQTISAIKTITGGNQGKMIFKNPNFTVGTTPESATTVTRMYFGGDASYNSSTGIINNDITTDGYSVLEIGAINNNSSSSNRASLILRYEQDQTRPRLIKSWGDFCPNSNNDYDLGTSTNQWRKIYSADVVHTSGNETIGGEKVLTESLAIVKNPSGIFMTNPDITLGTPPTETNRYWGDYYLDNNGDQVGYSVFQCNKNGNNCILWGVVNSDGTNIYQSQIKFTVFSSGGNAFFPSESGCNLGLAANKWETFNGLNPGILSFPNINYTPGNPDSCDVSTALYNGLTASTYDPPRWSWVAPLSGWLTVVWYTKNLSSAPHRVTITAGGEVTSTKFGQTFTSPAAWFFPTAIPVVSGVTYYFDISFKRTDSASEILSAYVVPCQGNV